MKRTAAIIPNVFVRSGTTHEDKKEVKDFKYSKSKLKNADLLNWNKSCSSENSYLIWYERKSSLQLMDFTPKWINRGIRKKIYL